MQKIGSNPIPHHSISTMTGTKRSINELGLPSGRKLKKKHRNDNQYYDTSARYLNTIRPLHPLVDIIIEHRALTNLLEQYITLLPKFAYFHRLAPVIHFLFLAVQQR